jgi:PAS domain S-box-containing protein
MRNKINDIALFQSIFEASIEAILVVDDQGVIIKINPVCCQLFGYSQKELLNKKIEILIPEKFRKIHKTHRHNYVKSPYIRSAESDLELWGRKKDGTNFRLDLSLSPVILEEKLLVIAFVSDITERIIAKKELIASEKNMAEAQSVAQLGSWYWNLKTDKRQWSDEFYRIYGLEPNDDRLNAQTAIKFIHPDDRVDTTKEVERAIAKKGFYRYEKRIVRPDKTIRNIISRVKVNTDAKGKPVSMIGTIQDVTQLKKEEFLKEQINAVLEMIAHHKPLKIIGNAIIEIIENNINSGIACILLFKNDNEPIKNLSSCHLPTQFNKVHQQLIAQNKKKSFIRIIDLLKKQINFNLADEPLWDSCRSIITALELKFCWSFPILSAANESLGVFLIYNQFKKTPSTIEKQTIENVNHLASVAIEQYKMVMTLQKNRQQLEEYTLKLEEKVEERTKEVMGIVQKLVEANLSLEDQFKVTKEVEAKVIASQALFNAIASNFPKGIIVVVNKEFEIVYIEGEDLNDPALKKSLYKELKVDEIDIFHEKQRFRIKYSISKTLLGQRLSFETNFKDKTYAVNTSPLYDQNNKITEALLVYSDITHQKKTELEILHNLQKEKELNELKSRFISIASHEFRTPLSTILTSARLIEKQNSTQFKLKRLSYTEKIKSNVRDLVTILNDFLSLSKLEEGKMSVKPEQFDIVVFSESIIEEMSLNKKKGQQILIHKTVPHVKVYLDSNIVHHILQNLLSNAIKYSKENQEININIIKKGKKLLIAVTDKGIGIPKDEQRNLFTRFFRAGNANNIQGTGLGLYIVKQYIQLIGGSIDFKSTLNEGSTFIVKLPLTQN